MELNVKLLDNSQVSVSLPPESSVRDLKGRLKERIEVSEDRQRLIYRGRVLQDAQTLMQSGLETGTTLHCVVRPENLPAPIPAPEGAAQAGMQTEMGGRRIMFGGNASLRESGILSDLLRLTNPQGQPNRLGRAPDAAPPNPDSLEHIRQGLLTMHTLLSGMGSGTGEEGVASASPATAVQGGGALSSSSAGVDPQLELSQSMRNRRFFVGQWLDVKDTVSQWLEATVMEIRGETLKVHYNGWPTRWDEWLPFTSPRIAPFRTRTLHTSHAAYMSPYPVSHVRDAPATGQDDIRTVLPEVLNMVRTVGSYIEALSGMCEEDLVRQAPTEQDEEQERPWLQRLPWEAERAREEERRRRRVGQEHISPEEEIHQVAAVSSGGGSPGSISSGYDFRGSRPGRKRSLHEVAADVAPLLDRCGRVLADLAPHVSSLAMARGQRAPREVEPEAAAADTTTAASTSTSRPRTGRPAVRDRNGPRSRTPSPHTAFRQLIAMPARPPNGLGMPGLGPNVDIHIHAFVTPIRTNAAATATGGGNPGTQEAPANDADGSRAGASARTAEAVAAEDAALLGLASPAPAMPSSAAQTTTNPSNTFFPSSSSSISSTTASSSSNNTTQAGVTPNAYYGLMSSSLLASPTARNAIPGPSTAFSSTQSGETTAAGAAPSGSMEQHQPATGHGDTDTAGAGGLTQFFSLLRRFSS